MIKLLRLFGGIVACLAMVGLLAGCGGSRPAPTTGQVVGSITLGDTPAEAASLVPVAAAASPSDRVASLQSAPAPREEDADGLLVKFRPAVPTKALRAAARSLGVVGETDRPLLGVKVWRLDRSRSIAEVVRELRSRPEVEYAEPNRRIYPLAVPSDPEYAGQWNLPRLLLPGAWDITTGSSAVVVAVIDSGIRLHPDLAPDPSLLFRPWDFVDDDADPTDAGSSRYPLSHGTHVAGTIGALTNNGLGVAGVNWSVRLMPLRILGTTGTGTEERLATAVRYAVQNGAQVINMSLGFQGTCGRTLSDALTYAHDQGVTLVAAAGNEGSSIDAPANHPDVISVGATNSLDRRTTYSNYGTELDLVAPGGDDIDRNGDGKPDSILSTSWDFPSNKATYVLAKGTSMAAPHVTGVVALMLADGIRDPETIRTILHNTATDLGPAGRDAYYGYGLVNAQGALSALARVKILLANALSVEKTTMPNAGGAFTFRGVAAGTRYLAAWFDANGDGTLDAGDYYAESPAPILVTAGQTTTLLPAVVLNEVSGSPAVSHRFKSALGLT